MVRADEQQADEEEEEYPSRDLASFLILLFSVGFCNIRSFVKKKLRLNF